jgi:hypothetical protein
MSPLSPAMPLPAIVEEVRTPGVSKASANLQGLIARMNRHLLMPVSRAKIVDTWGELSALARECQVEDWDGYGARPIPLRAFFEAGVVVKAIPAGVSSPEVIGEPQGAIGFHWERGKGQALVLSVSGAGELQYAAILPGGTRKYGSERLDSHLPGFLVEIFHTYFSA